MTTERAADAADQDRPQPTIALAGTLLGVGLGRFVDGIDPGHGRRGADLARSLRGRVFDLDDTAFELLTEACETHTDGLREGDFTVRVCWDADRLDLGRCLIAPDPERLATPAARDPRILAWADERAHDQHVPSLVRDIWRPLLDGDGDGR